MSTQKSKKLAVIATVIVLSAALATPWLSTIPAVYADGDHDDDDDRCDSTDLPDAAGPTGNPHTCDQPTGNPHDAELNPDTGNPHNT